MNQELEEKVEEVWKKVEEKIRPAVREMVLRKDSGPVIIHFGSGELKSSTAQRTL